MLKEHGKKVEGFISILETVFKRLAFMKNYFKNPTPSFKLILKMELYPFASEFSRGALEKIAAYFVGNIGTFKSRGSRKLEILPI